MYEQCYCYAAVLLSLMFAAGMVSIKELYRKPLQLYNAVAQHSLAPLVQAGHVRATSVFRTNPTDQMHPSRCAALVAGDSCSCATTRSAYQYGATMHPFQCPGSVPP